MPFVLAGCDLRAAHQTDDPALTKTITALTAAVTARTDDTESRRKLADAHLAAEHWFAAAELYKQVVEVDPTDGRGYAGLSDAYLKLAYLEPAFEALGKGVRAEKFPEECMLRLAEVLRSDGSPEAIGQARDFLARFIQVAPQHPRIAEARALLRQIDVQLSTTPGATVRTGTVAPTMKIPEHQGGGTGDTPVGALNPFGQAIQRAIAAVQTNDPVTAEKALKEALTYQPDDVGALSFLAETYLAQDKVAEARSSAERAYKLEPTNSQARWAFGLVNIRTRGDIPRALEAWKALAKDDPDFAREAGVIRTLEDLEKARPGLLPP